MTKRTLSENLDLTLDYNAYHLVAPTVTINGNNVNQDTSTTSSPSFRGLAVFGDITSTGDVHANDFFVGGTGNVGTILTADGIVVNTSGINSGSALNIAAGGANIQGAVTIVGNVAVGDLTSSGYIGASLGTDLPTTFANSGVYIGPTSSSNANAILVGTSGNVFFKVNNTSAAYAAIQGDQSGGNLQFSVGGTPALNLDNGANVTCEGGVVILAQQKTIATSSSTGIKGMVVADANFIYVCTATNTWKRVAISTW